MWKNGCRGVGMMGLEKSKGLGLHHCRDVEYRVVEHSLGY